MASPALYRALGIPMPADTAPPATLIADIESDGDLISVVLSASGQTVGLLCEEGNGRRTVIHLPQGRARRLILALTEAVGRIEE